MISDREIADKWTKRRKRNENLDDWSRKTGCDNWMELTEEHEINDQLRWRDSGAEKHWDWRTPEMIAES